MSEFEMFLKNPYWKAVYDNAPQKVKEYYKIAWDNNSKCSDTMFKEVDKKRDEFAQEDWLYIISQSHGRAKYEYTKMMKEKFPE